MIFEKQIKINGKSLNELEEFGTTFGLGTDGKVPTIECDGKKYKSFLDLVKQEDGYVPYNSGSTRCGGWVKYWSMLITDTFADFCKDHSCEWLIDVIVSYYPYISKVMFKYDENHKCQPVENPKGADDFLVLHLQKVGKNSAIFSVEQEVWNEEKEESEIQTIVLQYIPYTDIDVDSLYLYLESGVVIFPEEH